MTAISDTVQLALIVAIPAFAAPVLMAILTNWLASKDKKLDYARQDAVAKKVEDAANLLRASNDKVAETTKVTNGKLDLIHTLVNSNMTAAMQSELNATVRE